MSDNTDNKSLLTEEEKNATWDTWDGYKINYNKRETLKNIGGYMTEKMYESLKKRNDDTLGGDVPTLGFPGSMSISVNGVNIKGSDYYNGGNYASQGGITDDKSGLIDKLYSDSSGTPNSYYAMFGDPRDVTIASASSKGLAMGESKILNPDFQFNELDDVRSDFRRPMIGRLYSERIYDYNLPKVLFQVGTVSVNMKLLTGLTSLWFNNASGKSLGDYLRDPSLNPIKMMAQKLSAALGTVVSGVSKIIMRNKRMYKFTPNGHVYLSYVNEILAETAAWMGLGRYDFTDDESIKQMIKEKQSFGESKVGDRDDETDKAVYTDTEKAVFGINDNGQVNPSNTTKNANTSEEFPAYNYVGKADYLDIKNILPTMNKSNFSSNDTWDDNGDGGFFYNTDCMIPFGLSKGVNVSETFSNETQENPVTAQINSTGQNNQQQLLIGQVPSDMLGGVDQIIQTAEQTKDIGAVMTTAGQQMWGSVKGAGVTALKNLISGSMSGEVGMVQSGNSRMILPEIWTDSNFDRQYTINMKLFSPYGNKLSIFENTIVPMLCLIAMTAPRQVGESSYTTPFYVKAFSKGLFSTDLGMISSLSISRSEEKSMRTQDGFSRQITVSISVKDLLPRMTMSLDAGMWGILSSKNQGFRDYLAYVAGIDLMDRDIIRHKWDVYSSVLRNKWNFDNWGSTIRYVLSQSYPVKLITSPRSIFFQEKYGTTVKSQISSPSSAM